MSTDPRVLFKSGITKPLKKLLQEQVIEPGNPGPLLWNAQSLIDAIAQGMSTTSKYFALPQGRLDELNQRMSEPLAHNLKRPQLRSFPALMGLFLLLRTCGLAVGETKPKRIILIDPAMLEQWNSFNPTERYMSLLEAWLVTARWDTVGERGGYASGMKSEIENSYCELTDTITNLDNDRFGRFYGVDRSVTLNLLHQFGWVRVAYDATAAEGNVASLRSVERLPFGDAMFAATCSIGQYAEHDSESMRGVLKPFFPEWMRSLKHPEAEFRAGEHTLKLSWGNVWRRLVAPAETTLDEVAGALLSAFKFDDEHLYQFEFRDSLGRQVCAVGPMCDGDFYADELRLGDLPISEGDTMTMVYDFGDNWKFNIKLEKISDKSSRRTGPKITEKSGTAPKQYRHDDW